MSLNKKKPTSKQQNHTDWLSQILNDPNTAVIDFKEGIGYLIEVDSQQWLITASGKHTQYKDEQPTANIFYMDYKTFYLGIVAKKYARLANSGKVWTKDEEAALLDMIHDNYTFSTISMELKREVPAIFTRAKTLLKLQDDKLLRKVDPATIYDKTFAELDLEQSNLYLDI